MNPDWQDADPAAYDPDNPLALLENAAKMDPGTERDQQAVWAARSMLAAGAGQDVMQVARKYAKRETILTFGEFDALIQAAARGSDDGGGGDRGPSIATQFAEIAQELYEFGVSDLGEPFAIPRDGPKVTAMLRGSKTSLRALLSREYFTRMRKVASQQALTDALLVVEGFAQEQEPSRLYVRCAEHDGALWLDLGDQTGRAVRITARGWSVEDEAPVLFKRTALTGPLPEPKRDGSLGDLWKWLNVTKDDRPLVAAELVARLFSDVPHVVLAILGEHGTAKTTTTKILVSLLDPSPVLVRKPPRDMESWVTMAAGSWVVAMDNLSDIPPWLSDSICRASTGEGDVRRKLWTDSDYSVFSFRRCVIFNGIEVGALASDLADRTLPITLQPIPDDKRKNEKTFWAEWDDARPKLLGAILSLASDVLRRMPGIQLEKTPRMADYALVLAAIDAEFGTKALARYADQGKNLAAESLSDNILAAAIIERVTKPFEGTSAALLKDVTPRGEWQQPKDWPKNAQQVTGQLTRLAPAFRKIGWTVENLGNDNHNNVIHWKISLPAQDERAGEEAREPSQDSQDSQSARDARDGEPSNGLSHVAGQEKTPAPACPRHQTRWGAHSQCPDCQALAEPQQ